MTIAPLNWSKPRATGWATIEAKDGANEWRITPVPRDVTRIYFAGVDATGTIVAGTEAPAYAESIDEAKIVIDLLRAGSDTLPEWREQLEAADFVRTYPRRPPGDSLAQLWHDKRKTGLFQITVRDGIVGLGTVAGVSVGATYESNGAQFWHNVCEVNDTHRPTKLYGEIAIRSGLPEGVDILKVGVAAVIAIRAARQARGGSFAVPLGGPTKSR